MDTERSVSEPTVKGKLDLNLPKCGYLCVPPEGADANTAEWKRVYTSCNKYGISYYNSKNDTEPIKRMDPVDLHQLVIEANPVLHYRTSYKCFELSSSNHKLLFGVQSDKEREEWIKYFHQIHMAIIKKVNELREKFAAERRLAESKLATKEDSEVAGNRLRSRTTAVDSNKADKFLGRTGPDTPDLSRSKSPPVRNNKMRVAIPNERTNSGESALVPKSPTTTQKQFIEMQGFVELKRSQVSDWQKRKAILYEKGRVAFYHPESKEEPPDLEMNLLCYCPIAEASSSSRSNCVALMQHQAMCVVSLLPEDLNQWLNAFAIQGVVQNVDMLMQNSKYFTEDRPS
eukprot:TRINITY_DN8888_c0_g1_i1.p1 TRINITY_DN8888_c0_g1~~TRINITY_DN8888_c0_g1_i1.p1  ORF type:complete len:344 (+),score=37.68 TRINITY_DN8888_c0_g1_i1:134-1165(+)